MKPKFDIWKAEAYLLPPKPLDFPPCEDYTHPWFDFIDELKLRNEYVRMEIIP